MARWKLATAHYLSSPGVDWEYKELNRKTMRQERRTFPVPLLIDPLDSACWTTRWGPQGQEEGECIVCLEGKGEPSDIVFFGDPTPDMIPVDAEAEAISSSFAGRWKSRPDAPPGTYSQSLISELQDKISAAYSSPPPTKVEGMEALVASMDAMMKQNQQLIEQLAHPMLTKTPSGEIRRV